MAQLFGRAWKIQVLTPANQGQQTLLTVSSSDAETQSLRVVFDVYQSGYSALWKAEVDIYNPNLTTMQTIVEGCQVSVAAGYVAEGTPTEIFRGTLFQAIWSKPDSTTVILKLICYIGLDFLIQNFTSTTIGPGATQRQIVLEMARNAQSPVPIAYVAPDSAFVAQALPRSTTIFGQPSRLFGSVAKQNDMSMIFGADGLYIGPLDSGSAGPPDVIYAPPLAQGQTQPASSGTIRYCLIGTPQQTQQGCNFRVLLDPKLNVRVPAMQAQIKNAVIEQQQFQVGTIPTVLSQDGVYFVAEVRFIGDTRGNEWWAEVVGVLSAQKRMAMLGGNQ
jgi:hypothetical protein